MYTLGAAISEMYGIDPILLEGIELAGLDNLEEDVDKQVDVEHGYTLAKLNREYPGYNINSAEQSKKYNISKRSQSYDYTAPTETGKTKVQFHHTEHPVSGMPFTYGRVSHHVNHGDETISKFAIHKGEMLVHVDGKGSKTMKYSPV